MTFPTIQPGFFSGELAPSLWGRVDLEQFHTGASTLRNLFVNYRGGASSRAGSKFCGACLQNIVDDQSPPRLIPFQFSNDQGYALEFGDEYMRVLSDGGYVLEDGVAITGATQTLPIILTIPSHPFSVGDWLYVSDVEGMTQINGKTFIVTATSLSTVTLNTQFNRPSDGLTYSAYTSGGQAARLFTLETPWTSDALPALKFAQSADVMTICHPSYPPYELSRLAANDWAIASASFGVTIASPGTPIVTPTVTTTVGVTDYYYQITAIGALTGEESLPSPVGSSISSVDVAVQAGALSISWSAVSGASSYNIYRGPSGYSTAPPAASLFGYVGSSFGPAFIDGNTIPDLTKLPPQHFNPFAQSSVLFATVTSAGTNYQASDTATISTSTGTSASLTPVIISGGVRAVVVNNPGQGYRSSDSVVFSTISGAGAVVSISVGPSTGTYPSCVAYFQQRRIYANTNNNPDTYFMSHIGQYNNFDTSIFPTDSEPVIGTPWAQQVNGIQALVPMPGGLVVLTGLAAWQVSGGSYYAPVTPTSQNAQPQAFNGCHSTIPPIVINYNILYVQSQGTIVRDMQFDFFSNIYTGADVTQLSSHLFEGYNLVEWAWCEEPYKVLWAVRDDGKMLSLTYLKDQKLQGWARHDTNGLYKSVCSIIEPPVNALYQIVQRRLLGAFYYVTERVDDRLWQNLDDVWAVDCGLALDQPQPNATLFPTSATGERGALSIVMTNFGSGYTAPVCTLVDLAGGQGAILSANVVNGEITSIDVIEPGEGYIRPTLSITDPTGEDATGNVILGNISTMIASTAVFSSANVGDIIRIGGGVAEILAYEGADTVRVNLLQPIVNTIPNSATDYPLFALAGQWTLTTPTTLVQGLDHLVGQDVSVLADGAAILNKVVTEEGTITLDHAASNIVVGLPFTCQIQSPYLDLNSATTVQGKRKNIQAVTVRVWNSRGVQVGANQIDASTLQPLNQNAVWSQLTEIKDRSNQNLPGLAVPLFTGDARTLIKSKWEKPGQVAVQQIYPLPLNCLAIMPEFTVGDSDG